MYNKVGLPSTILCAGTVEFSYDPHDLPQPLDETAVTPYSVTVPRWYELEVVLSSARDEVMFVP